MYPPRTAPAPALEAAVADPPAWRACLDKACLFHTLSLAHTSQDESWAGSILWPRRPRSDDYKPLVPSSGAGPQRGSATRQAARM
jgi:hypothetical protein